MQKHLLFIIQKRSLAYWLLFIGVLFSISNVTAQNYTILGSATTLGGCDCFRITPNANGQAGAIFQNKTINLNNSFDYTFSVFFGCNNGNGADGLTFALTSNPNGLGNQGEGLGYAGNNQPCSFAVEFDTYQNNNVGDPSYHHIAFNSGGQYNHNVAGPVPALPNSGNIDDCQSHTVRIVWDVNSNTYSVYFNGDLRLSAVIPDIVGTYFCGNPIVNWGWTAATGGSTNEQRVCVESTSNWVAGINYQSCNTTIQFTDVSTSNVGNIQSWAWTFGDGTTSNQQNPLHTYPGTGTYNVTLTITDFSGCTNTYSRDVVIGDPIVLNATLNPPPCNGGSNGGIVGSATGGFGAAAGYGGYSFQWSNGQNIAANNGITAGTYTVTVTDGVCTTTGQYTLDQPTPLTATTTSTAASCGLNNGSVSITISGGTLPYIDVSWAGIMGATQTGLPPGPYIADFTDANGCSALLQYKETVGSLPCGINSTTSATNVNCYGGNNGSATLTVTGGTPPANITWSNGGVGATITNLIAGTYTYNYTDGSPANSFSGTVTVTEPPVPLAANLTILNTSCTGINDGSAVASITSGGTAPFSYAWSQNNQNNPVNNNLAAGPISVTITDAMGCTVELNDNITGPPDLTLNISVVNDSCYQSGKGSATANVTGGNPPYTYYWDNISPAQTNLGLKAGTYNVTVTDNKGCTITGTAVVGEADSFSYSIETTPVQCFGDSTGSILITATGGTPNYDYTWNPILPSTNNPVDLAAGNYFVTITDANNCSYEDSTTITEPIAALAVSTTATNVTCNGANDGSITLTVSGGTPPYSFMGNPVPSGTSTLNNLPPNTYDGNIQDANGCTFAISETITEPAILSLSETHTDATCFESNDGTITIDVTGGTPPFSFDWGNGITSQNLTDLTAGNYTLTATDSNLCTATLSLTIGQPSEFIVSTSITDALCFEGTGSITLTPQDSGSFTYEWQPNVSSTNSATVLAADNYNIIVTNSDNCTVNIQAIVSQPDAISVNTTSTNISCFGDNDGSIIVSASGGVSPFNFSADNGTVYNSSTGAFNNMPPGNYNITVTDENNCTASSTAQLSEPDLLISSYSTTDISCFGESDGSISITASGGTPGYIYNWAPIATNGSTSDNLSHGIYNVTITDDNGCTTAQTITLEQPLPPTINTEQNVYELGFGKEVVINTEVFANGNFITNYTWTPIYGLDCTDCESAIASPLSTTPYTVSFIDENGCTATTSFVIEVSSDKILFVPNAFSPNGDGINDLFVVSGFGIAKFKLNIFDRWGTLLFESTDINNQWDGTYLGKKMGPGVYVYSLYVQFQDTSIQTKSGSITIIR